MCDGTYLNNSWTTVTGVEYDFRYEAESALGQGEVQRGSQGFVNTLVVFQHILHNIIRFMNAVPLGILVWMLHFKLQLLSLLGLLCYTQQVIF